jgi:hypothetical protein
LTVVALESTRRQMALLRNASLDRTITKTAQDPSDFAQQSLTESAPKKKAREKIAG